MTIHRWWDGVEFARLYKAIYWDTNSQNWVKWRTSLPDLEVEEFFPETRTSFYGENLDLWENLSKI